MSCASGAGALGSTCRFGSVHFCAAAASMVKKKGKGAKAMDTGDGGESYTYGPSVAGGGAKVRLFAAE